MNNEQLNEFASKTLELTRKDFALRHATPEFIHSAVGIEACIEESTRNLYVSLCYSVYGVTRFEVIEIEAPSTWFDHFKLRWFPVWLLKRYPVKYRNLQYKINVEALFTDLAVPSKERKIRYRVMGALKGYQ
jgi:hypothetical protein